MGALYLNILKSRSLRGALYQVWLKLVKRFSRRKFLNFVNVFSLFRNYLPLEKGMTVYLNKSNPLHTRCFVSGLVDIGPVVLEKKMKMWNVYRQTRDNRRSDKLTQAFSSGELKTNLNNYSHYYVVRKCRTPELRCNYDPLKCPSYIQLW